MALKFTSFSILHVRYITRERKKIRKKKDNKNKGQKYINE